MNYTQLPTTELKEEIDEICCPTERIELLICSENITYFAYHNLGITPYTYQHKLFQEIQSKNKRIMICSSRQLGKSTTIAIASLWATFFNKFPSGLHNNTKIGIVSKSDLQSKKLMNEIKKFIVSGDYYMSNMTDGQIKDYFSSQIDNSSANNMSIITWKNGSFIKCFPPTDAINGETLDGLFLDEAAFVGEQDFKINMEPTISATNGFIFISSTPVGQHGMFFNMFDPYDKLVNNPYMRYWFNWEMCENPDQKLDILKKKKIAEETGDIKSFDSQYNALFTADESSFFDVNIVNDGIDSNLSVLFESRNICSMGIDYGMANCYTVITISAFENGIIKLIYQYSYPLREGDITLTEDVRELCKRFNVSYIVVDDCSQGYKTNMELKQQGYPVQLFNFRTDQANRNRNYFLFKSKLYSRQIKYPNIPQLIAEMKALQEVHHTIHTSIRAASGVNDDRIDSFMMSTVPFLEIVEGNLGIETIDYDDPFALQMKEWGGREDKYWQQLAKN